MYKIASQNSQDAARSLRCADLERGELELTDEQRRASLVAKWKRLQAIVTSGEASKALRKKVGAEMCALQTEINAIRPKRKAPGAETFFIEVVREMIPPAQFRIWMTEAIDRLEASKEPSCAD